MPKRVDAGSVVWEEPPKRNTRYDWDAIAQALEAKPLAWGKVFENGRTSVVNAVRSGSVRRVAPHLGFEVRTSDNVKGPPKTCTFYLRYNPDKDTR